MPSSSAIKAGRAFVEVFADSNPLVRGLNDAKLSVMRFSTAASKRLDKFASRAAKGFRNFRRSIRPVTRELKTFGKVAAGITAAGAALAGRATLGQIGDLDQLNKAARAFGLAAENASGLFGVFNQSGATNMRENIESLVTLSQRIKEAASGQGGQSAKLFDGLNVSAQELARLDPSEQFFRLHGAIMQLEEPTDRISKLMLAFGEDGGKTLIPTLSKTTEELRKQAGQFSITQEELEAASQAQESLNNMSAAFTRILQQMAVVGAPSVEKVADAMTDLVDKMGTPQVAFARTVAAIEAMAINLRLSVTNSFIGMAEAIEDAIFRAVDATTFAAKATGALHPAVGTAVTIGQAAIPGFERTDFHAKRNAALVDATKDMAEVFTDLEKAQRDFRESMEKVEATEAARALPVEAPRPGARGEPDAPPDPVIADIAERSASAGINAAAFVNTREGAAAIAKAMSTGKAAEWEKKNNKALNKIVKNTDKEPVDLGVA